MDVAKIRVLLTRWGMHGATEPTLALVVDRLGGPLVAMQETLLALGKLESRIVSVTGRRPDFAPLVSELARQVRELEAFREAIGTWSTMTAETYRELFNREDPKRRAGAN